MERNKHTHTHTQTHTQSLESFERFQYFQFETNFLEIENIFQKTGVLFVVESTKIKNASFPYKTAVSEDKVKTNRIVS